MPSKTARSSLRASASPTSKRISSATGWFAHSPDFSAQPLWSMMALYSSSFVAKWRKMIASETPAACAISLVVVPRKPRSEKRRIATRTICRRRSSPAMRTPVAAGGGAASLARADLLLSGQSLQALRNVTRD